MAASRAELWLISIILSNVSVVICCIIFIVSVLVKNHTRVICDKIDLPKIQDGHFQQLWPIFIILGNISFVIYGITFIFGMLFKSHKRVIWGKFYLSRNPKWPPLGLKYSRFSSFWLISHLIFVVSFSLLACC